MAMYYLAATQLLEYWGNEAKISHVAREANLIANEMAHRAYGAHVQERGLEMKVEIQRRSPPSLFDGRFSLDVMTKKPEIKDWRTSIIQYLDASYLPTSKKIRRHATKFVMWDKILLRKTPDGLLLKCLDLEESMRVMAEVHEGIYEAYQAGTKMRWLRRRYDYFLPDMEKDCKAYARGCEECQRHRPLQHTLSVPLNPVVKPWPFRG
ncbi:hypothetical protein ACFX16_031064 [Malus domestica]